jgi:hypothetical protein
MAREENLDCYAFDEGKSSQINKYTGFLIDYLNLSKSCLQRPTVHRAIIN